MSDGNNSLPTENNQSSEPLTRQDLAGISEQLTDLGGRVEEIQVDLDASVKVMNWHKLAGQVSSLEVRLSNVEKLLERIAQAVNVPVIIPQPYIAPKDTPDFNDIDPIGEMSPGGYRSLKKNTGTLRHPEI